ncbi:cation transporter [Rothia aeria]|uniref:cation transporter n=1 Tax=Rothia aeria TaxID=172042 RepID=UPI0028891D93|nr:cation transporter [Rothia aeria]
MWAAFLEVLNDTLGPCAVIIASIAIVLTGAMQADAIAGLFIAVLVVSRAVHLLWKTASVLIEFTPKNLDLDIVHSHVLNVDGVVEVHDVHTSTIATGYRW